MLSRRIFIFSILGLLLAMAYGQLRDEGRQQEASMQATLAKMCPMVWKNMERVRAMPQGADAIKWCPET